MTIKDLHIAFKTIMDKNERAVAFGGCPAFVPQEIDLFLNQAYLEIVCTKFTGSNTRQEAFEGSVKRISDLSGLVVTENISNAVKETDSNRIVVTDFNKNNTRLFFIEGILTFKEKKANINLIDHITAQKFLKTYNNNPWIPTPVATLENNNLYIYIDDISMPAPYKLTATYVKYPTKIDYTKYTQDITEVPETVLYEVINRAALIALESIESQRAGTKSQINQLSE